MTTRINSSLSPCRDADLSDHQLVQIYTAGLVNPLRTDVALRRSATLDDTVMLARAYEQCLQLHQTDPSQGRNMRPSQQSSPTAAPKAPPGTNSSASAAPGTGKSTVVVSSLPQRRLS
jgi:hypothetical protein